MSYADDLAKRARVRWVTKEQDNDAYYLALEKEVDDFLDSDASEEDKEKVRGGVFGLESLYMICSGIRFEWARCNILDAVDNGLGAHAKVELYDFSYDPDRMVEQLKEDGLLDEKEQLTDAGREYLERYKDKPVMG